MAKLWGGRFSKDTDKLVEDFHSSISFDQKLYKWDITGSKAHARMLGDIGVLTKEEAQQILAGLDEIMTEIEKGQVAVDVRMYLRHEIENTHHLLLELMKTVVDIAEEHKETILPGYTHLQRAQPVSFAHHMLAYAEMFTIAKQIAARETTIMPLFVAGAFYYVFNLLVAGIMGQIEKKLSYYK